MKTKPKPKYWPRKQATNRETQLPRIRALKEAIRQIEPEPVRREFSKGAV